MQQCLQVPKGASILKVLLNLCNSIGFRQRYSFLKSFVLFQEPGNTNQEHDAPQLQKMELPPTDVRPNLQELKLIILQKLNAISLSPCQKPWAFFSFSQNKQRSLDDSLQSWLHVSFFLDKTGELKCYLVNYPFTRFAPLLGFSVSTFHPLKENCRKIISRKN